MSATNLNTPTHATTRPSIEAIGRIATYATSLAGIYLSVGFLFYFAAKEKLVDDGGTMPAALQKLFSGSFFASVPGDNAAWILLGLIEAAVVILSPSASRAANSSRNDRSPCCSPACPSQCSPTAS
jgi:hypothetical protein